VRWPLFFAVLWIAAVTTAWWHIVPFEPEYVLPQHVFSPLPINAEEMLATTFVLRSENSPRSRSIGPCQVLDIRTGAVRRSFLDADWTILAIDLESREKMAVRRGDEVRIVHTADGSTMSTITSIDASATFSFGAAGRLLLAQQGKALRAYDAATGELKWSRDNAGPGSYQLGSGLVAVISSPTNGEQSKRPGLNPALSHCELLIADTGEPHPKLTGSYSGPIYGSLDGSLLALRAGDSPWTIVAVTSGETLWKLPPQPFVLLWFNDDGNELQVPFRTSAGVAGIARWNSKDGTVIAPFPKGAVNADLKVSADGRFACELRQHHRLPRAVSLFFRRHNWRKLADLTGPAVATFVIDLQQHKILGRLPADELVGSKQPFGPGFLGHNKNGKGSAYYSSPPGRNWRWLLGWSIGPIALVWVTMHLASRWRNRSRVPPAAV